MRLLDKLLKRSGSEALPPPTYSNDAVIERIAGEEGVDRATARMWFGEMLIFLDLCARSKDVLSPPPSVDKAWHAFLLHTHDYEAYCVERFGRLIHHQPAGEPDEGAYARAYRRRGAYRGSPEVDPMVWAVPVGYSGDGGDDGSAGSSDGGDSGGWNWGGWGGGDSGSSGGDSGGSSGGDSGGSSCGGSSCGGGGD